MVHPVRHHNHFVSLSPSTCLSGWSDGWQPGGVPGVPVQLPGLLTAGGQLAWLGWGLAPLPLLRATAQLRHHRRNQVGNPMHLQCLADIFKKIYILNKISRYSILLIILLWNLLFGKISFLIELFLQMFNNFFYFYSDIFDKNPFYLYSICTYKTKANL